MNAILCRLKKAGCDVDTALPRLLGDEEFLLQCIRDVLEDINFIELKVALGNNETKCAFEAAHTLKGIIANTGLTPLYPTIVEIVELLRCGEQENIYPLYHKLIQSRYELKQMME